MSTEQIPLLNTKEAATRLEIDQREVVRRIRRGEIKATKWGWSWAINEGEIDRIKGTMWYRHLLTRQGKAAE